MRLLIDTHVLIWWWSTKDRLSRTARHLLEDEQNEILVSAASAWETATKQRIGKLTELDHFRPDFEQTFLSELAIDRFLLLPISGHHGLRAGTYEVGHGDPFDRMLAAQAELGAIPLLTSDPAFTQFPCETLW